MQDNINDIIGQKAFDQVEKLDAKMAALEDRFTKTAQAAVSMAASLGDFSKIKDLTDQVNKLQTTLGTLTKQQKEYTMETARANVESKRKKDLLNNAAKEESELTGAYARSEAALKRYEKAARDMSLTYGVTSSRAQEAIKRHNELKASIVSVDQAMGNHRRNVGNYQGAVFSLSQVLRELPSFTYSAQQGFLAIGNNMPILIDQFKMLKTELGSTKAAIGAFAKSIFSFVNVFTILSGLFTIFYKDIMNALNGVDAATEAFNKMKAETADTEKEVFRLKETLKQAQAGIISKTAFLNTYNDVLGGTLGTTEDYNTAEAATIENVDAYLKMVQLKILMNEALTKALEAKNEAENIGKGGAWNNIKATLTSALKGQQQMGGATGFGIIGFFKGLLNPGAIDEYKSAANQEARLAAQAATEAIEEYNKSVLTKTKNNGKNSVTGKGAKETKKTSPEFELMKSNFDAVKDDMNKRMVNSAIDQLIKIQDYLDQNPLSFSIQWTWVDKIDAFIEQAEPIVKQINSLISDATSGISDISQAALANDMMNLEKRERDLKSYYDNELRFIEQTGLSQAKKAKLKQKLDAETEAKQKQIDRDRITAMRKAAQIQRGIDIANVISTTALAIMKAWAEGDPWSKPFRALAAGFAGAAQLGRIIATPLPQYAKGRKGGKAEMALVGEKGTELIRHSDGSLHVTPNKPTVTFLPEGADVIPNHELLKQAAYVKLQGVNNITPDKYGAALLAAFEDNTAEVRELKNIMASKDYSLKVKTLQGYNDYIKSKLR